MLSRYETLFLTVPEITQDESKTIEKQLYALISVSNGSIISFEKWGKYKLAYPVRKYDYGVYFLMRFEIEDDLKRGNLINSIRDFFNVKHTELVMRHVIVRLNPKASLAYKKPDSLEEVPTIDVDEFLKENKMTGLLSSSVSHPIDKSKELEEDDIDVDEEV